MVYLQSGKEKKKKKHFQWKTNYKDTNSLGKLLGTPRVL